MAQEHERARRRLAGRVGGARRGARLHRRRRGGDARGARGARGPPRPDAREPRRHGRADPGRGGEHGAVASDVGRRRGARARRSRVAAGDRGRAAAPRRAARRRRDQRAPLRRRRRRRARSTRPATSARRTPSSSGPCERHREEAMSVELHHRLDGPEDAPVLMLSNSLGTALEMWDDLLPALAEHFRVLRYDQRGHGALAGPAGALLDRRPRPRRARAARRLGLERVAFCGVLARRDDGHVARDQRARADRPPRRSAARRRTCRRARCGPSAPATVREQGMEAVVDAALERWFTPALAERRPEVLERTRADAARHADRGLRRLLRGDRRPRPARGARRDRGAHA